MTESNPLARYLVPLRRWWWVVAAAAALGVLVAWVTLPEPPREPTPEELADPTITYRATYILVRNPESTAAANFDLVQLLARQGDLANRVVERMDGQVTPGEVEAVGLEPDPNTGTLSITAVQSTPDLATELSTTFAAELNELLQERDQRATEEALERANERLATLAERIDTLEEEISELQEGSLDWRLLDAELDGLIDQYTSQQSEARRLAEQLATTSQPFDTLQEPSPVSTAVPEGEATLEVPTDSRARFALATVLALLLGIGVVFGIDYLDTKVRTRHEVEVAFGLPVIAELPRRSTKARAQHPLPVRSEPDGPTAEAVRSLRLAMIVAPTWQLSGKTPTSSDAVGSVAPVSEHAPPRSVVVTSPLTGDGKTTLVANLAASFADAGQSVLVVDCDFRRPAVGGLLGVKPGKGLRELADPYEEPLKDLVVATSLSGIQMVRSGQPGIAPAWFVGHSASVIEQAVDLADVVLFDTGPLLLTNEALALIPEAETTLVVARSGRVNRDQARDAVERLTRVGANVSGVALVGTGAHGYGYYETAKALTAPNQAAKP